MADLLEIQVDDRIPQTIKALLSPQMIERILDIVADAARNEWIRVARRELHTSKGEYINGIQPVESTPRVRIIALVGWLPNAVENGLDAFDLRETLLGPKSKSRRQSPGGWYARIPFRHATPGTAGLAGAPMGSSYGPVGAGSRRAGGLMGRDEATTLGKSIHEFAKRLTPTRSLTMGSGQRVGTTYGERLPAGLAPLLRGPNPAHPDPRMRAGHKTDIYAGMIREEHTYAKATQTQYMTFRTISTKVQDGWIHPGITAHHLVDKVEEYIARVLPATVGKVLTESIRTGFTTPQPKGPAGGGGSGGTMPGG